jgi:hypothetical protein
MFDPTGGLAGTGYSGAPGYVDNPADTALKDRGPLPEGFYTMSKPEDRADTGPLSIPLIPDATTQLYGRSGFFCHGDNALHNESGSCGCIVLGRPIREALAASSDNRLQVVSFLPPSTLMATSGV